MTPSARTRDGSDRGSILLLTLVVVVVLAALAVSIAAYASSALRTSRVTENYVDRIAAAESGATHALQAVAAANGCATYTDTLNDSAVTTTCAFQRRAINPDGLYALVITDLGLGSYAELVTGTCPNPNCTRRIAGPVFLDRNVNVDLEETQAVFPGSSPPFTGGNVVYNLASGDCTDATAEPRRLSILDQWDKVDEANGNADVTPLVICQARPWNVVAPTPNLAAIQSDLPAPATPVVLAPEATATCDVYDPGYIDPAVHGSPTLTIPQDAFFKSGVYHFHNMNIVIKDGPGGTNDPRITVGTRTEPAYQPVADMGSCNVGMDTGALAGTGALWVLSGSSNIEMDKSTTTFYPRDYGTAPDSLNVSLVADHDPAAPLPASTRNPTTEQLIFRKNPTQTRYTFHGHVWAPGGWIASENTSGGGALEYLGGIVAARLELRSAANVDGINISVPIETFDYYLIESTAANDGETTVRVVAFDDGSSTGLQVESWRVCARQGC